MARCGPLRELRFAGHSNCRVKANVSHTFLIADFNAIVPRARSPFRSPQSPPALAANLQLPHCSGGQVGVDTVDLEILRTAGNEMIHRLWNDCLRRVSEINAFGWFSSFASFPRFPPCTFNFLQTKIAIYCRFYSPFSCISSKHGLH